MHFANKNLIGLGGVPGKSTGGILYAVRNYERFSFRDSLSLFLYRVYFRRLVPYPRFLSSSLLGIKNLLGALQLYSFLGFIEEPPCIPITETLRGLI